MAASGGRTRWRRRSRRSPAWRTSIVIHDAARPFASPDLFYARHRRGRARRSGDRRSAGQRHREGGDRCARRADRRAHDAARIDLPGADAAGVHAQRARGGDRAGQRSIGPRPTKPRSPSRRATRCVWWRESRPTSRSRPSRIFACRKSLIGGQHRTRGVTCRVNEDRHRLRSSPARTGQAAHHRRRRDSARHGARSGILMPTCCAMR